MAYTSDSRKQEIESRIFLTDDNRYCGLKDAAGNVLIEPVYVDMYVGWFGNLTVYDADNNIGLYDGDGEVIMDCRYASLEQISPDRIAFSEDGKVFGLANLNGEVVVPCKYSSIRRLGRTGRFVVSRDSKCGVIDRDGIVMIPIKFEEINVRSSTGDVMLNLGDEGWRVCRPQHIGRNNFPMSDADVVDATVVSSDSEWVYVSLLDHYEGRVQVHEFAPDVDLSPGAVVPVFIEGQCCEGDPLLLSHRKTRSLGGWQRICDAFESGELVEGYCERDPKGDFYFAKVFGLKSYPFRASGRDLTGQTIKFKITYIGQKKRTFKVEDEFAAQLSAEKQRNKAHYDEFLANLQEGQEYDGTVCAIVDAGAIVRIGGVLDGILRTTDMDWDHNFNVTERFPVGSSVHVVVINVNKHRRKIALGCKQLKENPFVAWSATVKEGDRVRGVVNNVASYGVFLDVAPGVTALLHQNDTSWSRYPEPVFTRFKVGDEVESVIKTIDTEKCVVSLTLRPLLEDPVEQMEELCPIGSVFDAEVVGRTRNLLLLSLGNGIGARLWIGDISWTQLYDDARRVAELGERIDVMVLEHNKAQRFVKVGHKQLEPEPDNSLERMYPVGCVLDCRVNRVLQDKMLVELPDGLIVPTKIKFMRCQDGSFPVEGDVLPCRVRHSMKGNLRVVVSHRDVWGQPKRRNKNRQQQQPQEPVSMKAVLEGLRSEGQIP